MILVDDHPIVRKAIRASLDKVEAFDVVAEASSGKEALALSYQFKPDIVLVDIEMPVMDGLEVIKKLKIYNPDSKVIAVSELEDENLPQVAFKAGAIGYVTKSSSVKEMIKTIFCVYQSKRYLTHIIADRLEVPTQRRINKTPFELLSSREQEICLMIIQGYRALEIAERLNINPKTVNSYRYRIFTKLKLKNDVSLTLLAIRYRLLEKSPKAKSNIFILNKVALEEDKKAEESHKIAAGES